LEFLNDCLVILSELHSSLLLGISQVNIFFNFNFDQIKKGIERIEEIMDDIILDIPYFPDMFEKLKSKLIENKLFVQETKIQESQVEEAKPEEAKVEETIVEETTVEASKEEEQEEK
jgi:hypothetical protein